MNKLSLFTHLLTPIAINMWVYDYDGSLQGGWDSSWRCTNVFTRLQLITMFVTEASRPWLTSLPWSGLPVLYHLGFPLSLSGMLLFTPAAALASFMSMGQHIMAVRSCFSMFLPQLQQRALKPQRPQGHGEVVSIALDPSCSLGTRSPTSASPHHQDYACLYTKLQWFPNLFCQGSLWKLVTL